MNTSPSSLSYHREVNNLPLKKLEPASFAGPQLADEFGCMEYQGVGEPGNPMTTYSFHPGKPADVMQGVLAFENIRFPDAADMALRVAPLDPPFLKAVINCMIGRKPLEIIYTNDIHGAMLPMTNKEGAREGGIAYVAGKVGELRYNSGGNSLVLDGGDWGQGTMESNMSKGLVMTEIMNTIGYDAMEIGNHEFDWGPLNLQKIIQAARVPLLGANIIHSDGTSLDGVNPWVMKEVNGIKVGIIG